MGFTGNARDIALIILGIESLFLLVIPLALLGGVVYGLYKLNRWLRPALQQAQRGLRSLHQSVESASRAIIAPMINAQRTTTKTTTMVKRLFSRRIP